MSASTFIYIVTHYGCDSSHNDMWVPSSWAFTKKEDAQAKFNQLAKEFRMYPNRLKTDEEEDVCQDGDLVKRPEGVSMSRVKLQ